MKYVYKAALKLSYIISDLAEFIVQPLTDCIWNIGGSIEYWAHQKLTKLEAGDKEPKSYTTPASWTQANAWVDLDRYREAIAALEVSMRELKEQGIMLDEFKGMTVEQVFDKLKKEQG
jgi:hypothetical protein